MALTRKMLSAMDIPSEKIDEIINAHTETVNALKEERDQFRTEVENLRTSEKDYKKTEVELKKVCDELEKLKAEDWEKKYNDVKSEYDNFKTDTENKATLSAKTSAYKKLLVDAGIPEKRIGGILKVSSSVIDSLNLDDEGNAKDVDKLTESVKTEWADFIPETHEQGAEVANPPANNGGEIRKPSRAAQMVAQYRNEHYGNPMKEG